MAGTFEKTSMELKVESAHGLFSHWQTWGSIKSFTVGFIVQSKNFLVLSKNALHEKDTHENALLQACKFPPIFGVGKTRFGWVQKLGAFPR